MILLNVYRNSYQQNKQWEDIIRKVWDAGSVVQRRYYMCNPYNSESIINSFKMVHAVYQNESLIQIHCFNIDFDSSTDIEVVKRIINEVFMLYGELFQMFAVLCEIDGRYIATFVLNAVSYRTGRKFHDNNRAYIELINHLKNLFQLEIRCSIAEPVLFSNGPSAGNYTNILGEE